VSPESLTEPIDRIVASLSHFYHVDAWNWTMHRAVLMLNAAGEIVRERNGEMREGSWFWRNVKPGTVRRYTFASRR
jgi:hypothetical protein